MSEKLSGKKVAVSKQKDAAKNEEKVRESVKKWGRPLMAAGWTIVPNTLIEHQDLWKLDPLDMNILLQLFARWWQADNKPYLSKKTIAKAVGKHPRTVQRRIKKMEDRKLIRREERNGPSLSRQTNRYHFEGLIKAVTKQAVKDLAERKERAAKSGKGGFSKVKA